MIDAEIPEGAVLVRRDNNYAVARDGTVWRVTPTKGRGRWNGAPVPRIVAPLFMGPRTGRSKFVRFKGDGESHSVAQLVLEAFVGPQPGPGSKARYLNGDRLDTRAENLMWAAALDDRGSRRHLAAKSVVEPPRSPSEQVAPASPLAGATVR